MSKINEVLLILLAGCIGGIISALDAWKESFDISSIKTIIITLTLIPALKGAVASGLGVYLLTAVDTTQFVRSFFFAIACGLSFPSIIANGKDYSGHITNTAAGNTIAQSSETVRMIAAAAASASAPSDAASAINTLKTVAVDAIQATPKATPIDAKRAEIAVAHAIDAIAAGPTVANTSIAVNAIGDIGVAAAIQDLNASRDTALKQLEMIRNQPGINEKIIEDALLASRLIQSANPSASK